MTHKDLREAMIAFLASLDNTTKTESWCTQRDMAEDVLEQFARHMGIKDLFDAGQ